MILIISQEYEDSTSDVIDWLHFLGGKYKRYNDLKLLDEDYCLEINKNYTSFKSSAEFNEAEVVWYRRGFVKSRFHGTPYHSGNYFYKPVSTIFFDDE